MSTTWPKKTYQEALMDTPPGLTKPRPLRRPKDQQQAAELLTATWDVIPDTIQTKLQALGLGPQPPEEPGLTDILKTHMASLPQEVQAVVTRLTAPIPQSEKDIAQQLKQQVTEFPATREVGPSQKPVCCHAAGYAGDPNQAQRWPAKA